jgi:beta-galactosidase
MVPHAGPDSRVFREAVETGEAVERLGEIARSTVEGARVAVLWDADAWWALDTDGMPSRELDYLGTVKRAHRALWDAGVLCDFAHPAHDLSGYRLVLAPSLYLLSEAGADALRRYVEGGGTLLMQYFSGVVDAFHQARLGGQPGPLRDVFGIRVEQVHPLARDAALPLSDGSSATVWSEEMRAEAAEVVASYAAGPLDGLPAVTRHRFGQGTAWYVSTRLDDASYAALIGRVLAETGVAPVLPGLPAGVEAVRRRAADGRTWLFVLNHTAEPVRLRPPTPGIDLLTGRDVATEVTLPPGGSVVVREDRADT